MLHIEPLESRQLLSASIHSAAKPKPTIPTITNTFIGTLTQTKPRPAIQSPSECDVTLANETSKGVLAGSIQTSETSISPIAGTINAKGAVTLKVTNSNGKALITFTGKYDADNFEITGKYKTPASKGIKATSGTFVLED